MKNKNTIIKIIFVFITLWIFLYANAIDINLSIKDISKEWDNTLKVNFDTAMPDSWLTGEIKVFKDLLVKTISKDSTVANKIDITLEKDIKPWSTYNIFSVFWVEWSSDFMVEDSLNVKIISQAPEAQWITKITLKDKKNISLEFKNPLSWTEFEFKLLEDLSVTEINSLSWSLILKTSSKIENNNDYILILITLNDKKNNNYLLNESIYDFNIWADNWVNEKKNETDLVTNLWLDSANADNTKVIINSWSWTVINGSGSLWNWTIKNWSGSLWNIEKVAVKARTTPDTGPETLVLMLLTLIINSIYFLTRKFSH